MSGMGRTRDENGVDLAVRGTGCNNDVSGIAVFGSMVLLISSRPGSSIGFLSPLVRKSNFKHLMSGCRHVGNLGQMHCGEMRGSG